MNQQTDYTTLMLGIQLLMGDYNKIYNQRPGETGHVIGGNIGRKRMGEEVPVYTEFMDNCMSFVAGCLQHLLHPDLIKHVTKIAAQRHAVKDPVYLQEIRFSVTQPNPNYLEGHIVFVPIRSDGPLLTYTTSIPNREGLTVEDINNEMCDKLRYCYVAQ